MALPLDRSWFNTLIDDDGSGTTGTVWNKAAVDGLMDSVDASLVTVVDKAGGTGANAVAVFNDPDTLRSGAGLLHDGNTLTATAAVGSVPAAVAAKPLGTPPTAATVRLNGYSPSIEFLDKDFATNWYIGVNDDFNDGFELGLGAHAGPVPFVRLIKATLEVVLPYGRLRFPASPNWSTDPRTLDDYLEGTWQPRIAGTSGTSGNVYSLQQGLYTKIGKLIIAEFTVALATKGTISGNLAIDGFPYAAAQGNAGVTVQFYGLATNWTSLRAQMIAGTQYAQVYGVTAVAWTNNVTPLTTADIANGTDLRGVLMYHTA